jgi:LPS-assembly protein
VSLIQKNSKYSSSFVNQSLKAVLLGSAMLLTPNFSAVSFAETMEITAENIKNSPIDFSADELTYDEAFGTVTARGNVEVNQDDSMVKADNINYNIRSNQVSASGNVVIVYTDGTVAFADYTELSGNLKSGIIKNIKLILADKSKMAAKKAERRYGKNTLESVVYSPCDLCEVNPEKPPVWQVKALKVIHDEQTQDVEYESAWLEMFGVPIFYTPYLSHPGPEVQRRSGLLMPSFGSDSDLGKVLQTPFYYAPNENVDFTFNPMFTSKENIVLAAQMRNMLKKGDIKGSGSVTVDSKNELRSHIDANARYEINDYWRLKVDANRSSYDSYGKKYDFDEDSETWLESNFKFEGFDNRNYAALRGYSFQDLRKGYDDDKTPLILPDFVYHHVQDPDAKYGSYKDFKISSSNIYRKSGAKSNRLSLEQGWHLPYTNSNGEIYNFSASLRGDGYYIQDKELTDTEEFTGFAGRAYPEVSLGWRYPLVRGEKASSQVIEPMVVAAYSPKGGNSKKISNEDSRDMVLDDTNVMETNRFTGYDRVETGPRINYGFKWSAYGEKSGQASFFLGQSYRFYKNNNFADQAGLEQNFSDIVGRIYAAPHRYLDMLYRYSLNSKNLEARRSELTLNIGPPLAKFSIDYMFIDGASGDLSDFEDREEITATLESEITRYWSANLSHQYDLTRDGGPIEYSGHVVYEDECLRFDSSVERSYVNNDDYDGDWSIHFTLTFKSLGSVQTGGPSF